MRNCLRSIPAWAWALIAVGCVVTLGVTLVVEVRIVIVSPAVGDVSTLVAAVARVVLAAATLGSFVLGLDVARRERDQSGPERRITFAGENNEYTINLGFAPEEEAEEGEVDRPPEQRDADDEADDG